MSKPPFVGDIRPNLEKMQEEILKGLRELGVLITEKTDKDKSEIIAKMFSESRKTREQIGYQTMVLKTLEDNLGEIQFGQDTGISSKIQVSVGAEVFGTGVKWVLDVDTGKVSYGEILKALQSAPGLPPKLRQKVESKLRKFRDKF